MRHEVSLCICVIGTLAGASLAQTYEFSSPSDDRWHYPFNFTPGSRAIGSCFGAAGLASFNDRDGMVIVGWNTSGSIPAGLGVEHYGIRSVRITLTNQASASWPVDATVDEWFTYDVNGDEQLNADGIARGQPGDTDGESDDADPGRPIELFGAGFGPTYTLATWSESSIYVGSDSVSDYPRDPFPFVFHAGGSELHVEDCVKGLHNGEFGVGSFSPQPWAIGAPVNYTPGSQNAPFDVVFDVDLHLNDARVRTWFREQLAAGRVVTVVTSLQETEIMGSTTLIPAFYLKEGAGFVAGAAAPRLMIHVCEPVAADFDFDCDVDGDDLSRFEACHTGPGIGPPDAACALADFDDDADVDQSDFAVFQRCWSGPDTDPRPGCDE